MYSVFNPRGEKIADCGVLRDAVNLVNMRNSRWDGHYYQYKPDYQTIDVQPVDFKLPSITIAGQTIPIQQELPQDCQEPFIPDFHD
jgi:hypothetical protein